MIDVRQSIGVKFDIFLAMFGRIVDLKIPLKVRNRNTFISECLAIKNKIGIW